MLNIVDEKHKNFHAVYILGFIKGLSFTIRYNKKGFIFVGKTSKRGFLQIISSPKMYVNV